MGDPAARLTDNHFCPESTANVIPHVGGPILAPGAPLVLIGGLPAARLADFALCTGPVDLIAGGAAQVLINQLPAARVAVDPTVHGGNVLPPGEPMVLIGGPSFRLPANFKLHGDPDFQNKLLRDLYYLSTLPSGKVLLDRLAASGKDVGFWPSGDGHNHEYPVGGPNITYNPDGDLQTMDESGQWSNRPPVVGLAHEMVHSLHDVEGTKADGTDPTVPWQPDCKAEEAQTIGTGQYASASPSENSIRDDMGLPRRANHYGDSPRGDPPTNPRPGGY